MTKYKQDLKSLRFKILNFWCPSSMSVSHTLIAMQGWSAWIFDNYRINFPWNFSEDYFILPVLHEKSVWLTSPFISSCPQCMFQNRRVNLFRPMKAVVFHEKYAINPVTVVLAMISTLRKLYWIQYGSWEHFKSSFFPGKSSHKYE